MKPERSNSAIRRTLRPVRALLPIAVATLGSFALFDSSPALGQTHSSPVYVDDSTSAVEGLRQALSQASEGEVEKAGRLLQRLLEEEGRRLLPTDEDQDLFVSVRARVHDALLERPDMLAAYRAMQGPVAQGMLDEGRIDAVERAYLLTEAGYEAALRVAQRRLESAAFAAAWRTLAQLDRHPDRRGDRAGDALALLSEALRYKPIEPASALAARWRNEAAAPSPRAPAPVEGPRRVETRSAFEPGPSLDLEDMVKRPFWSEPLSYDPPTRGEGGSEQQSLLDDIRLLHIVASVAGDAVYVNDARSVAAWDRFTMSPRWRVSLQGVPDDLRQRSTGRTMVEDLNTVTVGGPWVIATTGLARQSERVGDGRVHAIDRRTGRRVWSTPVSTLHPEFEQTTVRGPVVIDQHVAIVVVSKQVQQRRLVGAQLAALDLRDGSLVWRLPLGSRGILPYATTGRTGSPSLTRNGLLITLGELGFIAGVESATGRVKWMRRFSFDMNMQSGSPAWQAPAPAIIDDVIYVIEPGGESILALDLDTGETLGRRSTAEFVLPSYLLATGETLVAVSDRLVHAIEAADFFDPSVEPRLVIDSGRQRLHGRVILAGEDVVAPSPEGLLTNSVFSEDAGEMRLLDVDRPGNPLAARGQLIVVDDYFVHSYLLWDVAEQILAERIERSPNDPTPAATYAELAHRAQRFERIVPALDQALRAIERDPLSPAAKAARTRLFDAALVMTDPDPDARRATELAPELIGRILSRQARLASGPTERVRHLLAEGQHHVGVDEPGEAVEAYQRILDEPSLVESTIKRHGRSLSAELQARARLRAVLERFGRRWYAPFEAEARAALAQAEGSSDPKRFAGIARRYPVSETAPRAWLHASEAYARRGRPHGSIQALEEGLAAAENSLAPGDALLGELGGRLVRSLVDQGRVAAASATLRRIESRWPGLILTTQGEPIGVQSLSERLSERLAERNRRPRIGPLAEEPAIEVLTGWIVAEPIIEREAAAASEYVALLGEGRLGLFGVDAISGLRRLWTVPTDDTIDLVTLTNDALILSQTTEEGVSLRRLDLATGETLWTTLPFHSLFPKDARDAALGEGGEPETIPTRVFGDRPVTETLLVMDGRTIGVIERSGRGAAFDLESGRSLWTSPSLVPAVLDVTAKAGQLLVGGASARQPGRDRRQPAPSIALIDFRTGRLVQQVSSDLGAIRWVRLSEDGAGLVGMDEGVASYDLFRGWARWQTGGGAGSRSIDAWLFPERLIVLNEMRELRQIDLETGKPLPGPLDTRNRIGTDTAFLTAATLQDAEAGFGGDSGLLIYDRFGQLVGADVGQTAGSLAPPAFGERRTVTISTEPVARSGLIGLHELRTLSNDGARLLERRRIALEAPPLGVRLLDGRILVTTWNATVVIDAPAPRVR